LFVLHFSFFVALYIAARGRFLLWRGDANRAANDCGFSGARLRILMMANAPAWSLHPQLETDTVSIGDLPLSRVLVIKDANYPWLLLVPRRRDVGEIIDLDEVEQAQLMTEIARVARALKAVTQCDKLNIAALGNVVPQLHVHVIARRVADAAWPRPVWGQVPAVVHDPSELDAFIRELRRRIWLASE
jgi:diadenosine tetraphosphate (Ap4A) HIT family hydrolase